MAAAIGGSLSIFTICVFSLFWSEGSEGGHVLVNAVLEPSSSLSFCVSALSMFPPYYESTPKAM